MAPREGARAAKEASPARRKPAGEGAVSAGGKPVGKDDDARKPVAAKGKLPVKKGGASRSLPVETRRIGTLAERGVHRYLKERYAEKGNWVREAVVDGKVADLVRYSRGKAVEVVEIQTRALHRIVGKVAALAATRRVRVVHPVAVELVITTLDESGEIVSGPRKSPKKGDVWTLFDELVRATGLLSIDRVTVEVAFVRASELRARDGAGSWRRKGTSVVAREVVSFEGSRSFSRKEDWLALVPEGVGGRFTCAEFAREAGIAAARARRVLYCLGAAGVLVRAGRRGRAVEWVRGGAEDGGTGRADGTAAKTAGRRLRRGADD